MKKTPAIPQKLKIALSVIFVVLVAVLVVRVFLPKRVTRVEPRVTKAKSSVPVTRKIVTPRKPAAPPGSVPRMAIILDDWGYDYSLLEGAIAIGKPVTLAILPGLKYSRDIARDAHKAGLGVMLHMPMQSKSGRNAEPHTILTTSSEIEILNYLEEGIDAVPYLEGINNHQGSLAASDERVMRVVLGRLKKKGLFFIDSRVVATSVGARIAEELGVPHATRDVFIDNVAQIDAVKEQLRKAKAIALKHGLVIVIGHDKWVTLRAILEMVPELEEAGIRFVYVRELVQ